MKTKLTCLWLILTWLLGCTADFDEPPVARTVTAVPTLAATESPTRIAGTATATAMVAVAPTDTSAPTATATAAATATPIPPSTPLLCEDCGPIGQVAWAGNDTLLLGGAAGIWVQPLAGGEAWLIENWRSNRFIEMAVNADGRYVAAVHCLNPATTSCPQWAVSVWQVADGGLVARYSEAVTAQTQLAFGGQIQGLLALSTGPEIRLWQIEQEQVVETFMMNGDVSELVLSRDETKLGIIYQRPEGGSLVALLRRASGFSEIFGQVEWAFAFDPTVTIGAITHWSNVGTGTVGMDYEAAAVAAAFRGGRVEWPPPQPRVMAFAPDGRWLAAGDNGSLDVWDVYAHALILSLADAHTGWVEALAFNPDQSQIATLSGEEIKVWSLADGELMRVWLYTAAAQSAAPEPP